MENNQKTSTRMRMLAWLMALVMMCTSINVSVFAESIGYEDAAVEMQNVDELVVEEIDENSGEIGNNENRLEEVTLDTVEDETTFEDSFENMEEMTSEEDGMADDNISEADDEILLGEEDTQMVMMNAAEGPRLIINSNVEWATSKSSTEAPYLSGVWFDEEPEDWDDEDSYAGAIDSDYIIKPSTNETLFVENYNAIQETCPLDYVEIAGLKLYFSDFATCSTWNNVTFDAKEYPGLFGKGIRIQFNNSQGLGIDLLSGYEDVTSDISVNFVFKTNEEEHKLSVKEGEEYILYAANYLRTQDDGSVLYGVYVRPKNGYQLVSYTVDGTEVPITLTEDHYVQYMVDGNSKQCNYFEIAISKDTEITLNCSEATVDLNLYSYNPVNAGDYISKYLWYHSSMMGSFKKQFEKHSLAIPLFVDNGAKFWYLIETNGFLEKGSETTKNTVKIYNGTEQTENNLIFDSDDPNALFSYDHADRVEEELMLLSDTAQEDSQVALSGREKTGGYVVLSKCPDLEKITLVVDYKGYHLVKTVDVQMAASIKEVREYTEYYTENYGLDKLGIEAYTEEEKQTEGYKKYCKYSNFRYVMRKVYQEYLEKIAGAKAEDREAILNTAKKALDGAARGEGCNAVVWSFLNSGGVTAIPVMVAIPNESNVSASDAICAALEALYPGNWSYNFTLTQFGAFVNSITTGGAEDTGCIHAKQSASPGVNYGLWFYNGKFSDWGVSNYYPADGDVMFWGGGDVEKNWAWAWLRLKYGDQGIANTLAAKGETRTASQLTADELKSYFPDEDYGRYGKFRTISAVELVQIKIGYIGTVTPNSGSVIAEARAAYDALSDAEKELVTNYDKLVAAEAAFANMSGKAEVSYTTALTNMLTNLQSGSSLGVGSTNGEWAILSLARSSMISGTDSSGQAVNYLNAVQSALKNGSLSKSTDYARVTLALSALGVTAPEELITQCKDYDKAVAQGINAVAYALIALDSKPYDAKNTEIREKYINYILENTCNSGGWILGNDKTAAADTDVTAMVIQALAPYYKDENRTNVKTAVDNALSALKKMQTDNGGFASFGTYNVESIAQVIVALTSVGQDPTTWNGKDAVDALLHFYTTKDGKKGFSHILSSDIDQMATEQATYALVAYYRFKTGLNTLYDMTDAFDTNSSSTDPAQIVAAAAQAVAEMESLTVSMENYNTEEAVLTYVKTTIETKMKLLGISGPTYEVSKKAFTPAAAGTAEQTDGVKGSFTAEVTISMRGAVAATKEVNGEIVPTKYVPKKEITVKFSLYGDENHAVNGDGDLHTYQFNSDTMDQWIPETTVTVANTATVGDVFKKVMDANGFTYVGLDSNYISKVTNTKKNITLAEFDNTKNSGWMYLVNGEHPNVGLNAKKLNDGDVIVWHWTDEYQLESGSEMYNSSRVVSYVENLIKEIGEPEGTQECKKAIEQARAAYDKLDAANQAKVSNYATLEKTEATVSASDWCWHTYGEGTVTKEATCTAEGTKTYLCLNCGKPKYETIKATGHKFVKGNKVSDATVFAKETRKYICSGCGKEEIRSVGSTLTKVLELPDKMTSLTMKKGKSVTFAVTMAKGDKVSSVKSSDTKILKASLDNKSGKITLKALKKGSAKLTIKLASGLSKTYNVKITTGTVKTDIVAVTNVKNQKLTLEKGKTFTLQAIRKPITSTQSVTYKTSNKKVATVTSKGKIKAVAAGSATITVTSGKQKEKITVTVPGMTNLKSSVTVKRGKSITLKPKTYGISQKVTYLSSNPLVATVAANGKITGVKKGTAKITVQAGAFKKVVNVKVK